MKALGAAGAAGAAVGSLAASRLAAAPPPPFPFALNDGRWAIQMVSTIFHETGYEDIRYPFVEEEDIRGSQGYLAAFGYRDEETLNDLTIGRGSYDRRLPVGTGTASVSFGYVPRARTRNARAGAPMAGWVTTGVTSRLNVSEVRELPENASTDTNLDEFVDLAGQSVGAYSCTRFPAHRPVVIHATHDKAPCAAVFPLHARGRADLRDAQRRHLDLQGWGLGRCRWAGTGDAPRPIELGRLMRRSRSTRRRNPTRGSPSAPRAWPSGSAGTVRPRPRR